MIKNIEYVNVALGLPKGPFTYRIKSGQGEKLQKGMRVRVPFRHTEMIGYVVAFPHDAPYAHIKSVIEVIDTEPIIDSCILQLCEWISDYYCCSLGEALDNALPHLIKQGRTIAVSDEEKKQYSGAVGFAHSLTVEQTKVVCAITDVVRKGEQYNYLLQGVTGSGKSEIYVRLMHEVLLQGKSVICMVPEIALTVQLLQYFESYFGDTLEVLHSKLTEVQRFKAWCRIRNGEKRVVLGPRSALFAPCKDVGLIIMDEEHENSYKQADNPRYHARDVAVQLARLYNAVFVMGTATPSLEARYAADSGAFTLLRLNERVTDRALPCVAVIDLKNEMTRGGNLLLSRPLRYAIENRLAKKESILLFLNRRGYATFILCMDCGEVVMCPSCKVSLTYHASAKKAICHYCNYQIVPPDVCAHCQSKNLKFGGVGTERVVEQVHKFFPHAIVDRLDTDRVKKQGAAADIIQRFSAGKIDILVGTQMLAKGFDFPNVTLVGVINADNILTLPDFRAFERGFQLLTQVAGRTGRGKKGGQVFVQTFMPDNYAVQYARNHAYDDFYAEEIENRRELLYPPFSRLINIIIRSRSEATVEKVCDALRKHLDGDAYRNTGVEVIGPAPLPFYKLRNYFRWHVMLKGVDNMPKMKEIADTIISSVSRSRDTYIAVDVDPISVL